MEKRKTYHACPASLQRVTEEEIRTLCTGLESNQNSLTFTRLLRGNDCSLVTDGSDIGSSSSTIREQVVEAQYTKTLQESNDDNIDHICIDTDHVNNKIDDMDMQESVIATTITSQCQK